MSAVVGPEMTPQRRATALRAFQTLPREDRQDAIAHQDRDSKPRLQSSHLSLGTNNRPVG